MPWGRTQTCNLTICNHTLATRSRRQFHSHIILNLLVFWHWILMKCFLNVGIYYLNRVFLKLKGFNISSMSKILDKYIYLKQQILIVQSPTAGHRFPCQSLKDAGYLTMFYFTVRQMIIMWNIIYANQKCETRNLNPLNLVFQNTKSI